MSRFFLEVRVRLAVDAPVAPAATGITERVAGVAQRLANRWSDGRYPYDAEQAHAAAVEIVRFAAEREGLKLDRISEIGDDPIVVCVINPPYEEA